MPAPTDWHSGRDQMQVMHDSQGPGTSGLWETHIMATAACSLLLKLTVVIMPVPCHFTKVGACARWYQLFEPHLSASWLCCYDTMNRVDWR